MAEARVVAVVRHRGSVLVCRHADAASGGSALPSAAVGDGAEPDATLAALLDALGVEPAAVERRGEPIEADGGPLVPFLVTAGGRGVAGGDACPDPAWKPPSALLRQDDDRPWRAYEAVAPTVETLVADEERGSTAIAVDALWVLRDAAARAAAGGEGLDPVASVAAALLDARPSMAALANRVNRAMAGAASPAEVEAAADDGLVRAHEADAAAAALAARTVDGGRVLTLSRSGTVHDALLEARPAVVVLASRPGAEGLAVAEALAEAGLDVATAPDAAVYDRLRSGDVDAVLVGADAVTPDGWVVNKVGTRAAALAAEAAGVPCYVACASDKVQPSPAAAEENEARELAPLEPLFDLTPPRLVAAVLTERGRLSADDVRAVAEEHRRLAGWRHAASGNG